jgi:hypothetical protein
MASLLCICDQGYRASIEEQDDTVVWMAHMLQRSETKTTLLLRGSAVNYANKAQKSVGVEFGPWKQKHPADFPRDLQRYRDDGGVVCVVEEDMVARGLGAGDLVDGVTVVAQAKIAGLVAEHDNVSFW